MHVINVGSISGSIPSQGIALYAASKSFLDAFTTALHRETKGTQVHVSVVRAGPVRSEFCSSALQRKNGRSVAIPSMNQTMRIEVISDVPMLAGGWFRGILLRKVRN